MALRDISSALRQLAIRDVRPVLKAATSNGRRQASGEATAIKEPVADFEDLESQSSMLSSGPTEAAIKKYDPVKRALRRQKELPPSR
jgi:hypothetical protein